MENPRATLDLDDEESHGGKHQGIDLVDGAIVREEFEIRPRHVRLMVWQTVAQELQRFRFPGGLGGRDGFPTLR